MLMILCNFVHEFNIYFFPHICDQRAFLRLFDSGAGKSNFLCTANAGVLWRQNVKQAAIGKVA